MNPLRRLVVGMISVYQRAISPGLPRHCKYEPTCSRYTAEAVSELGILRGVALAGWRLLRCNPFSHGGFDPVSAQRLFRRGPSDLPASAPRTPR
jgi:putative membrane protein insertion efficiency factor